MECQWALPLPLRLLKSLVVVDLNLNMPRPFQVKGVRVDMPRMSHSGYTGLEWASPAFPFRPLMCLSECIIFTFVWDIRDKDMKSDINIKNQTASKLQPMNGNVWTAIVVQNLWACPQFSTH
jgi:hypothetical protein